MREALRQAGRLDEALYVERASTHGQALIPVKDVDPATVPYFSIIIVPGDGLDGSPGRDAVAPGRSRARDRTGRIAGGRAGPGSGRVGLAGGDGGAGRRSTTSSGYAPYVNRVAQRERLQRHASGNTVELDRAAVALELAAAGQRVAVVSGGDAGVFGMAAAVFEAARGTAVRARCRSGCCPGSPPPRRSPPGPAHRSALIMR